VLLADAFVRALTAFGRIARGPPVPAGWCARNAAPDENPSSGAGTSRSVP
jgi:hypothetical protein